MTHFDIAEFACKCGCGRADMHADTLARLDHARTRAGIPFAITSGYRCAAHNARVGGKSNSAHTRGHAADIRAGNSAARYIIIESLLAAGFTRLGIAKHFIHADDDPSLPPCVIWDY